LTEYSAIIAVRHGAFDYLLKPSPVSEIIRAVEAGLTERQQRLQSRDPVHLLEQALANLKATASQSESRSPNERFLQVQGITVDTMQRVVVVGGQPVELTPTEFDILVYMMRHQEQVVSCRELAAHLRGCDLDERDARLLLRSHIHRLRHKLKRASNRSQFIRTVRGSGYIFSTASPRDVNAAG